MAFNMAMIDANLVCLVMLAFLMLTLLQILCCPVMILLAVRRWVLRNLAVLISSMLPLLILVILGEAVEEVSAACRLLAKIIMRNRLSVFFDKNAKTIEKNAFLFREINTRCFDRLELIKLDPHLILDLGAGVGSANAYFQQRYFNSICLALDISHAVLLKNTANHRVQANVEHLPLQVASIDLVYSNLLLHWQSDLGAALTEVKRVLSPKGLFLFSCFGVETLKELRAAFARVDAQWFAGESLNHLNHFYDMHDIGDGLVTLGFADPVMDMEIISVEYPDLQTLLLDIKTIYGPCVLANRPIKYLGKQYFERVEQCYRELIGSDKALSVSFEVIYGHAWQAPTRIGYGLNDQGEVAVPVSAINTKSKNR